MKKEFDFLISEQLKSFSVKKWLRAYYTDGLYKFIVNQNRQLPIEAGRSHFFMDPKGNIYPSVIDNQLMGNVVNFKNFADLWHSTDNQILRKKLKSGLVAKPSWMICTARTAMRQHPFRVGWWLFKKFFYDNSQY